MKAKETTNKNLTNLEDYMSAKYGAVGSKEREKFREEAKAFYLGQIIQETRKKEKITQQELAQRVGKDKAYISKIENGVIDPSTSVFYKLIEALGMRIEISKPIL